MPEVRLVEWFSLFRAFVFVSELHSVDLTLEILLISNMWMISVSFSSFFGIEEKKDRQYWKSPLRPSKKLLRKFVSSFLSTNSQYDIKLSTTCPV